MNGAATVPLAAADAARAVLANGSARAVRAFVQLLVVLILTYKLPVDHLAVALFMLLPLEIMTTLGTRTFTQSLAHSRARLDEVSRSAFRLNMALSLLTGLFGGAVAWNWIPDAVAANGVIDPAAAALLIAAAAPLSALSAIPLARRTAALDFRSIASAEVQASLLALAATAVAVSFRATYEVVLVYILVQRATELVVISRNEAVFPRQPDSAGATRLHLAYTLPLIGMHLLTFVVVSMDQIFVALVLGADLFALYALARRLIDQPMRLLMQSMERVLIPVFAALRCDPRQKERTFELSLRCTGLIAGSVFLPLAVLAEPIAAAVLPQRLTGAAPFLAVFAVQAALTPIGAIFYALVVGEGRTGLQLRFTIVRSAVVFLATIGPAVLMNLSALQFAGVTVAANVLMLGPNLLLATRAAGMARRRSVLAALAGLLPGGAGAAAVLIGRTAQFPGSEVLPAQLAWAVLATGIVAAMTVRSDLLCLFSRQEDKP